MNVDIAIQTSHLELFHEEQTCSKKNNEAKRRLESTKISHEELRSKLRDEQLKTLQVEKLLKKEQSTVKLCDECVRFLHQALAPSSDNEILKKNQPQDPGSSRYNNNHVIKHHNPNHGSRKFGNTQNYHRSYSYQVRYGEREPRRDNGQVYEHNRNYNENSWNYNKNYNAMHNNYNPTRNNYNRLHYDQRVKYVRHCNCDECR